MNATGGTMKQKKYEVFEATLNLIMRYFKIIIAIASIIIALSGFVIVDNDEVAVVLRFGRLAGGKENAVLEPGLHLSLPYFIDEVIKVPVAKVLEHTVDTFYESRILFDENLREMKNYGKDKTRDSYIITGDQNIVRVKIRVKYKITDAISYAMYSKTPEGMLDGVLCGELISIVSSMGVDNLLTSGKTDLASLLKANTQRGLTEVRGGITITNIEFIDLVPPKEALAAFEEANAALVQKETLMQRATQYKMSAIPEAEAEADSLYLKALVDQEDALSKARDTVAQFEGLYTQYAKTPEIIYDSVFRQRIGSLLKKTGASIITDKDVDSAKLLLP